jgi:hypothetical protein
MSLGITIAIPYLQYPSYNNDTISDPNDYIAPQGKPRPMKHHRRRLTNANRSGHLPQTDAIQLSTVDTPGGVCISSQDTTFCMYKDSKQVKTSLKHHLCTMCYTS